MRVRNDKVSSIEKEPSLTCAFLSSNWRVVPFSPATGSHWNVMKNEEVVATAAATALSPGWRNGRREEGYAATNQSVNQRRVWGPEVCRGGRRSGRWSD
ncbi:unnamed protein product [Linum trigynum]|uniref:Uncharacterized protein n=1 Tax=Linum trigynum TaxID=586398 RepID=A0AAV2GP26_9ROSI